ncbi:xylulokinase [Homoserinibacter sp. YIM 151385]|uniref:xylulokinase n=1 Tax=Homoserinibacter sp. YIM 151385 TaxID=2985506 RepID=UPI0022F13F0E|nr:FGGY family carbohydrate kinase [Homoserinibacter sp. YIM 151385]WBU39254.1 FGGY family carbohydrate kinase [Homoserinibacter sp. YIM 151385]
MSRSAEPVYVACDAGTTLVKAGVVDERGRILASAGVPSRLSTPRPGIVEQDLLEIERQAHEAIGRAVAESGRAADIAGVSFSSQMAGIGAVGQDFEPVAPFDSWLDSRCAVDILELSDAAAEITRISGGPPTYSHGTKQRWMKRERPEAYRRTAAFQIPASFLAARLAGLPASEAHIDASNLGFTNLADTQARRWSPELLELLGLDEELLPRIVEPTELIGEVDARGSAATGIPVGTPIAAGGGDQPVGSLGAGIVEPGQASDSAGTASLLLMALDRWAPDTERMSLVTGPSIVPGQYVSFAYINGGGLGTEWLRREVLQHPGSSEEAFAELEALAAAAPLGSGGLLWLPHFQGGVTPARPHLRSGWVGLTAGHGRGHLYRAILEGIAFQYAEWADRAPATTGRPLSEVRAMGGGSRSELSIRIKADVLGVPFVRMPKAETALLGGALIAQAATGRITDLGAEAASRHDLPAATRPDPARHARYRELRSIFDELAESADPVFRRLQRFSEHDEHDD